MCKVYNGAVQKYTSYMPKTLENTLFFDIIDIEISLSDERAPTIISCWVLFCIYRGLRYMGDNNENKTINIDLNNLPKHCKDMTKEEREYVSKLVKEGKVHHKQIEAGLRNIIPLNQRSPEERREICRKGANSVNETHGEKKNAKQILDNFLTVYANDDAIEENDCITKDIKKLIKKHNVKLTQYDLIMLAMISRAQQGDVKASAYISDLYGDIRAKEVRNINDVMSQADKDLIHNIADRLGISTDILDADIKEIE